MAEVTESILQEFKTRMHLNDDEDDNLFRILKASNEDLMRICGNYDITTHEVFKELVFDRSRYAYNDAIEHFYTNFLTAINNLNLGKALDSYEDDADAAE